jgi:hypothetical protein
MCGYVSIIETHSKLPTPNSCNVVSTVSVDTKVLHPPLQYILLAVWVIQSLQKRHLLNVLDLALSGIVLHPLKQQKQFFPCKQSSKLKSGIYCKTIALYPGTAAGCCLKDLFS